MALYRRRLPHDYETDQPVFLTWRLHDSLPCHRVFPAATVNSGQAFAAMDRLLEEARSGPFYLRQPAIADRVVEAIQYNAANLGHYVLHAFVVMPNHVHLLATPALPLPKLTKSLKGITSKRANTILAMTGSCFWQEESYPAFLIEEKIGHHHIAVVTLFRVKLCIYLVSGAPRDEKFARARATGASQPSASRFGQLSKTAGNTPLRVGLPDCNTFGC